MTPTFMNNRDSGGTCSGTGSQLAFTPSVLTYFPALPVCAGSAAAKAEAVTKAVLAICVVLVPAVAVGAVGVPVNAGDARGANPAILAPLGIVTVPVNVGDARGANPSMLAPAGIVTVPVNVGDAIGAFAFSCVWIALVTPSK